MDFSTNKSYLQMYIKFEYVQTDNNAVVEARQGTSLQSK